jgi:hypothetical protein
VYLPHADTATYADPDVYVPPHAAADPDPDLYVPPHPAATAIEPAATSA